jgi:hypothetical protein
MEHTFLAAGPHAWGKGKSVKEAFANCKPNLPTKDSPYYPRKGKLRVQIYVGGPGIRVSEMGGLVYSRSEMEPIHILTQSESGRIVE